MTGHASDLPIIFRYVTHSRVEAYKALGWIEHDGLVGTHHGAYSCLMTWPLDKGEPVEPESETRK